MHFFKWQVRVVLAIEAYNGRTKSEVTTFLFWNINQKSLENNIASLAVEHKVDVLMLAECTVPAGRMLKALNPPGDAQFHLTYSLCEKLVIYTRFAEEFIQPVLETNRLTIRRLMLPARAEVLLVGIHFPSKLYWSEESQSFECTELARMIREVEEKEGHSRTLLAGDFNMNPFEGGLIAASGMHAVMTRETALKKERTVQDKRYTFFYNPMWGHFGDGTGGPSGTYYYESAEQKTFFWNMFDQVLVRPDLLPFFSSDDLKILSKDSTKSFLSAKGVPDKVAVSDHLPILFKLNH